MSNGFATPYVGRPPARWELLLYRTIRVVVLAFCKLFWRLEVHGAEHLPTTQPFILAPSHRSNIDSPVVGVITKRRMRFMAKKEMWKVAWAGKLWVAIGAFPVDRGTADREALRTCEAVIEGGEPLVMFPEGSRQSGPVIQPLFDGPAFVAARTGAPIVPVGIGGAEGAMPAGSKFLKPVKLVVVIGPPLAPPQAEDGKKPSRRAVKEKTAELHAAVQVLFDEAQKRAGVS